MKPIYKIWSIMILLTAMTFTSCEGEKDLVVIEGNLPVKTETLYMVGDATPSGWNIDQPTPFTRSQEDVLIFLYEGHLNAGEFKCPLSPGYWGGVFVMPVENGVQISKAGIAEGTFSLMPTGQPDNKWKVVDAGTYKLTFDLRNWTVSATYVSE